MHCRNSRHFTGRSRRNWGVLCDRLERSPNVPHKRKCRQAAWPTTAHQPTLHVPIFLVRSLSNGYRSCTVSLLLPSRSIYAALPSLHPHLLLLFLSASPVENLVIIMNITDAAEEGSNTPAYWRLKAARTLRTISLCMPNGPPMIVGGWP